MSKNHVDPQGIFEVIRYLNWKEEDVEGCLLILHRKEEISEKEGSKK